MRLLASISFGREIKNADKVFYPAITELNTVRLVSLKLQFLYVSKGPLGSNLLYLINRLKSGRNHYREI